MSAGLSIVKSTPIGGGQEFCGWLMESFGWRAASDDASVERVWIPGKKVFNEKLAMKVKYDKSTAFVRENRSEISKIRNHLCSGGVELSISW